MTAEPKAPKRSITPRRWALAGTLAGAALAGAGFAPMPLARLGLGPAVAAEAGEAGEAGVVRSEGPAALLTEIGLFEAAHRITAALYAKGSMALAREHLELSHHAFYDDIAPLLEAAGAPGFEAEAAAFTAAVATGAGPEAVAEAEAALGAAIDRARAAARIGLRDQVLSIRDLVAIAAADFAGGVSDGEVIEAQEYRDAWGFVALARARAAALAASAEPVAAKAGADILAQLAPLDTLLPGVTSTKAPGDVSLLPAAAAWIEIIALRIAP